VGVKKRYVFGRYGVRTRVWAGVGHGKGVGTGVKPGVAESGLVL
jgi:hypothetical protein